MLLLDIKKEATELADKGNLQAARPLWINICEQEPTQIDNWLVLSAIDEQLGFLPAALGHLKYAFHLDAKDPDIWMQSASLHWQMRHVDQAFQNIYHGLAIDFNRMDLRLKAAEWLLRVHDFEHALIHYCFLQKSQQLNDDDVANAVLSVVMLGNAELLNELLGCREDNSIDSQPFSQLVADKLSLLVLPKKYTAQISRLNRGDGASVEFCNSLAIHLKAKDQFDVQRCFDNMAHTEFALLDDAEKAANQEISDQVVSALKYSGKSSPGVIEVGCGIGLLGMKITESRSLVTITGLDFSAKALRIASKQNSYASLINHSQWQQHSALLLRSSACIVMRSRALYYTSRDELVDAIVELTDQPLTIIIEIDNDSADVNDIDLLLSKLDTNWTVRRDNIKDSESYLLCLAWQSMSDKALSAQMNIFEEDVPEKLSNQLITAQLNSLARQDYEQACDVADSVLEHYPNSSQGLFIKGVFAQHNKDYPTAIHLLRSALRKNFGYVEAWFQLATIWHALGRYQSMLRAYNQCLKFGPNHILALKNLAMFYLSQGDWGKVNHCLCNLLLQNPLNTELREYCDQSAEMLEYPQVKEAYLNFLNGKDFKQAQFRSALDLKYFPRCESLLEELTELMDEPDVRLLRVNILDKSGRLKQAIELLETLIVEFPDNINYLKMKRSLLLASGNLQSAHEAWEQLLERYEPTDGDMQGGLFVSNYYYFCSDQQVTDYHLNWGKNISTAMIEKYGAIEPSSIVDDSKSRKIRVGYVSGDLKMHSVSMFLYNIYKHHDKDKFEIISYATNMGADPMMMKMRLFSDLWRDISKLDNEKAAKLIKQDRIDILVDLSGHTGHGRLPLFCLKPAPIQGTYLGYANTTGLEEVDFRFTDEVADPTGLTEHLHTEKLIRLPDGFLSYSRHSNSSAVYTAQDGNQERRYSFVCCNNIQKVNFEVIRVFCEILKRVPDSNILIKAHNFNNPDIITRYHKEFQRYGISEERVHLMNALDLEDHQELYNYTKIALDPWPYSGTTTTCDALWMGVPVLTYAGTRHSSRVSASILKRVGLDDWVANSEEEYIEKAVSFINNADLLEKIKLSMRYNMLNSPLMHPTKVCRDIEAAYQQLFVDHQNLVESES